MTVTAGAATQLSITTEPAPTSPAINDTPFTTQPIIQLGDGAGNLVASTGVTTTAELVVVTGSGTLGRTLTAAPLGKAPRPSPVARPSHSGSIPAPFAVSSPDKPHRARDACRFWHRRYADTDEHRLEPLSGVAFVPQPVVQVLDAHGNAVAVTVSIDPSSVRLGTLGGTVTVVTDSTGNATYSVLSISASGSYRLVFTATGPLDQISATIVVT